MDANIREVLISVLSDLFMENTTKAELSICRLLNIDTSNLPACGCHQGTVSCSHHANQSMVCCPEKCPGVLRREDASFVVAGKSIKLTPQIVMYGFVREKGDQSCHIEEEML
jgi:hypothetical protein